MTREAYFEANTYGIGQLITQRKLFAVPEHQRDFSWTISDVEAFFDDISQAMLNDDPDYFIGLIVLLGPRDNKWTILDGQQRLATTTMVYSAIRDWLWTRGLDKDANQIDSEFIAVRMLGGGYLPRLAPNVTNRELFNRTVVEKCPDESIQSLAGRTSRYSSNRLLLDANMLCRHKVRDFVSHECAEASDQPNRLFRLSNYLETRVRVVTMDVSSEANAFTIFESLNARGNELAVVDLVKNHVFGKARSQDLPLVQDQWQTMAASLDDKDLDDYLKTFWTSQFGRVQKTQLYERIKREYANPDAAKQLVSELADKANSYIALDDPGHDIWVQYGTTCQQQMRSLSTLGSRQFRAPIMSAIHKLEANDMAGLLWGLIVLTVRHQIVGRRRTGLLEIFCANLANAIHSDRVSTKEQIYNLIRGFMPMDEEFSADFKGFSERKKSRARYLLAALENTKRRQHHPPALIEINAIDYDIVHIYSTGDLEARPWPDPGVMIEYSARLANLALVENELNDVTKELLSQLQTSSLLLTRDIKLEATKESFDARQECLADLALKTWTLPETS